MSKRVVYSIIGLIVVAWVVLYLTTYGVLVGSTIGDHSNPDDYPVGALASRELDPSGETGTLRCTYFVATAIISVYYDPRRRKLCPRLRSFDQ